MIPFFALIGLVTVISIIVNLQINRHSLFCKITGTIILILACIFACFVILFPLSFGNYQNLILSFGIAFVLLIGIYVFVGLTANKRRFKNVAFVAAEGDADTSDSNHSKKLAKPVQLKHAAVPQTHKIRSTAAQATRSESKHKNHLKRSVLDDPALIEKEATTLSDFVQPEYRDTSSLLDSLDKAKSRSLGRDFGMQLETGAIGDVSNMAAQRIEIGQMDSGDNAAEAVDNLQGEISVKKFEQNDSGESANEQAADMQAEPAAHGRDDQQLESVAYTPEDDTDLHDEQKVSEIDDEQAERNESADANVAGIQEYQVAEDSDSEQADRGESAVEDIADLQDEREISDIVTEQTYRIVSDNEGDVQIADEYMDAGQTESSASADIEASDIQEDQVTEDSDSEQADSDEPAVEDIADLQDEREVSDIVIEQTYSAVSDNAVDVQNADEYDATDVEQVDSCDSADTEAFDIQEDQVTEDSDSEQADSDEPAVEEDSDDQTVDEDSVINAGQSAIDESAADANDVRMIDEESVIDAGQVGGEVTAVQEDKYSRVITKAIELKDKGEYLNTIFMLQSVYDKINDEAVMKQTDILLLECLVLSKQYPEGQKKWFEILSKRYDFEPEEKAKIKAVMGQLNAGQL